MSSLKIWGNPNASGPKLDIVSGMPKGRSDAGECPFCSTHSRTIYHAGTCPRVKRIEYYPDGTIKAVQFKDGSNVRY